MTDTPLEETWSPEPVKAWRYFYVGPLTWNWEDDRWEVMLRGDIEEWTGPVKYAGQHDGLNYLNKQFVNHESPHVDCACGVNAVKELESHEIKHRSGFYCGCYAGHSMSEEPERSMIAVTPVELAGIVDEYEQGYRAQQATIVGPLTLFNGTPKVAEVLAENYGVTVDQDWYPLLTRLEIQEHQKEEAERGHRQTDPSHHRGTGTGQDPGAGKGPGTRNALNHVAWATAVSGWYVIGTTAVAQLESLWRWPILVAIFVGGSALMGRFAVFLKDQ